MDQAWAAALFLLGVLVMLNLYFHEARIKELLMSLSEDLTAVAEQLGRVKMALEEAAQELADGGEGGEGMTADTMTPDPMED